MTYNKHIAIDYIMGKTNDMNTLKLFPLLLFLPEVFLHYH